MKVLFCIIIIFIHGLALRTASDRTIRFIQIGKAAVLANIKLEERRWSDFSRAFFIIFNP